MLSPEYLEHLPEPLIKLWQQVEDDILRDIARRIRKMDTLTDTAAYQAFRLEQTKLLRTDIVKLIAKYSGKSETVIRKLLIDAAVETLRSEDAIHAAAGVALPPINESKNLLNLLNAGYRQTLGTWKNLTATTANTVTRQFEDALDRAWLQVSSGAFDYQTAIRSAIDDLAQHMDGVTYPSGHHDSLEVAARRATLTGVNQTCGQLQWERLKQAGCKFVEVTAHSGARSFPGGGPKDHAGWQGKVYHIGGAIWYKGVYYEDFVTATGYRTGDGLCGWNCSHNFHAFYPGISVRTYTDEQLAEMSAKSIEYNGKMYSQYEINQMQRARERNVRKWKKTWMAEKEAGLDTTNSAIRLKNARKSLNDFTKETGGRVDSSRTAVWNTSKLPGKRFGHSEASSAGWDVRRHTQSKAAAADLAGATSEAKAFFGVKNTNSLKSIIKRGTMKTPGGFACFPDGDVLGKNIMNVPPKKGYFDVAMHGSPTGVGFGSKETNMTSRLLSAVIRHSDGYDGQKIRLLACSTGRSVNGDYCCAEELANILGVEVLAPNLDLYISENGSLQVGDWGEGQFIPFTPNQRRRIK